MFDIIQRLFSKETGGSKDIAKERLRLVLVHDRAQVSPQLMEILKEDIIKAISHHMDINERETEVSLTSSESSIALIANIPINRMKRNTATGD